MGTVRNTNGIWINTEPFREVGNNFITTGRYTDALPGTLEFDRFWDQEYTRCMEGYEVSGAKITGKHYFYLNYCLINKVNLTDDNRGKRKVSKGFLLPDFWDGDYEYFWFLEIAENGIDPLLLPKLHLNNKVLWTEGGKSMIVGKARRRGFSYKNAATIAWEYTFVKKSLTLVAAYDKKYLFSEIGIFTKVMDMLNHLNTNCPAFKRSRLVNKIADGRIKSGYIEYTDDGTELAKGHQSSITCVSFMNNPDAARGADASKIIVEEAGTFVNWNESYYAMEPSIKAGDYYTGMMIIFGCVCAGTKVWTHDGRLVNIEDLRQEEGIVGYAGAGIIKEPIVWMQPHAKKPCYRITTEKNKIIECSNDHPLLVSKNKLTKGNRKVITFKKAEDIKVGEQLMSVRQVPIFGSDKMWNPRLLGLLLGDGYYGKGTPEVSIDSDGLYNWITSLGLQLKTDREKLQTNGRLYRRVSISKITNDLRNVDMYGQSWETKQLPINLHKCDVYSVSEFLGGYFDADGSVYYNSKKNSLRVVLTSKYKHLLEGVSQLLYKLNVGSSIVKEYRKTGYKAGDIYRLYISKDKDVIEFKKHISFKSEHKQKVLDDFVQNKNARYVYDNCLFEENKDNGKGQYYLKNNKLDNLESNRVKSIEFIGDKEVYNLNAGITHTYITNGFVSGNTGGDMEAGTIDFAEMYYNPDNYNMMPFENVWDEEGLRDKSAGFFFPMYQNYEGAYDKSGNSDIPKAKELLSKLRENKKAKAKSPDDYLRHTTEYAWSPSEAFQIISNNVFPTEDLRRQLGLCMTKDEYKGICGKMTYDSNGNPEFVPDLSLRPLEYRDKTMDKSGCIQIWEKPTPGVSYNLYTGGLDPYATDEANYSDSLGSLFIFKRYALGEQTHDLPVAEYTGRPQNFKEFYDQCILLIEYYNASCLYENNINNFKTHCENKHKLHLLSRTPSVVKAASNQHTNTYGIRVVGNSYSSVKNELITYVNNWLREEYEDGKSNVYKIKSIGLLQELITYNSRGNFDRFISFSLALIRSVELTKIQPAFKDSYKRNGRDFFSSKLFSNL